MSRQGPGQGDYENVPAGTTEQQLGGTGAAGDYIETLIVRVSTLATGTISLIDGATTLTFAATNEFTSLGNHVVYVGLRSKNAGWKVTTGAGCSLVAVGDFT